MKIYYNHALGSKVWFDKNGCFYSLKNPKISVEEGDIALDFVDHAIIKPVMCSDTVGKIHIEVSNDKVQRVCYTTQSNPSYYRQDTYTKVDAELARRVCSLNQVEAEKAIYSNYLDRLSDLVKSESEYLSTNKDYMKPSCIKKYRTGISQLKELIQQVRKDNTKYNLIQSETNPLNFVESKYDINDVVYVVKTFDLKIRDNFDNYLIPFIKNFIDFITKNKIDTIKVQKIALTVSSDGYRICYNEYPSKPEELLFSTRKEATDYVKDKLVPLERDTAREIAIIIKQKLSGELSKVDRHFFKSSLKTIEKILRVDKAEK